MIAQLRENCTSAVPLLAPLAPALAPQSKLSSPDLDSFPMTACLDCIPTQHDLPLPSHTHTHLVRASTSGREDSVSMILAFQNGERFMRMCMLQLRQRATLHHGLQFLLPVCTRAFCQRLACQNAHVRAQAVWVGGVEREKEREAAEGGFRV